MSRGSTRRPVPRIRDVIILRDTVTGGTVSRIIITGALAAAATVAAVQVVDTEAAVGALVLEAAGRTTNTRVITVAGATATIGRLCHRDRVKVAVCRVM